MSKPSSPPLFSAFLLLAESSVCLPFQVTVSAVSGWRAAWSFPKVCQLLLSASGDQHQKIHQGRNGAGSKGLLVTFIE